MTAIVTKYMVESEMPGQSPALQVHLDLVFGRVVAFLRTEEDSLSQVRFAERCRMSPGSVARIEAGAASLSAVQEYAFETALLKNKVIPRRGAIQVLASRVVAVLRELGHVVRGTAERIDGPELPRKRLERVVDAVCSRWLDRTDAAASEEE